MSLVIFRTLYDLCLRYVNKNGDSTNIKNTNIPKDIKDDYFDRYDTSIYKNIASDPNLSDFEQRFNYEIYNVIDFHSNTRYYYMHDVVVKQLYDQIIKFDYISKDIDRPIDHSVIIKIYEEINRYYDIKNILELIKGTPHNFTGEQNYALEYYYSNVRQIYEEMKGKGPVYINNIKAYLGGNIYTTSYNHHKRKLDNLLDSIPSQ